MTMQKRKKMTLYMKVFFAALISLIQIMPIVVVVVNSFRGNDEISKLMLGFPTKFHFENYAVAWTRGGYAYAYASSLIIGFGTAGSVVLLVGLAVYGLYKTDCFFKEFFKSYFVAGLAIPTFAVIVPLFFFFYKINLINTHIGMILIYIGINIPFNFTFMSAFFEGMSKELDEAARIDGASEMQNLWHIVVPLAKPIMTSVMLIVFVNTWNEFLFSNTFLQKEEMRTVSLRFFNFVGKNGADYGYIYAAAIISILPIIIIYFLMQDSFVEGMTTGSVKG